MVTLPNPILLMINNILSMTTSYLKMLGQTLEHRRSSPQELKSFKHQHNAKIYFPLYLCFIYLFTY